MMNPIRILSATALASAALSASSYANAQGTNLTAVATDGASSSDTIIVTGSRIPRPEIESNVPVVVVGAIQLQQDAALNVQDSLQKLPQFGIGTSRANSNLSNAGNGAATLNLRNLGSARTLVLVNGRRFISGFAGSSAVDVNNIPTEFIDRVEVITGGASSVYGSEAIAGVVNFIMKDKIDGIQVRAQSGLTEAGDNARYLGSLTAGTTLLDERLSLIGNFTYDRDEGLRSASRARSSEDCGTPFGAAGGIVCGPASYSPFSAQGQFYYNLRGAGPENGGNISSFSFVPGNSVVLGNGPFSNRNADRFISVPVERYLGSFNLKFDVSDDFQIFAEGTYAKVKARSSLEPATIAVGMFSGADVPFSIAIDNPFIPSAIQAAIAARNSDGSTTNDVVSISARRRLNEVFDRSNRNERDTYRGAIGFRGNFGNRWNYDASFVYGRFEDFTTSQTAVKSRLVSALDAVTLNGQIVCRDAAARADGCVPLNIFGYGTADPRASAYVQGAVPRSLKIVNDQYVASANITGSPFALWAGDVSLAAGVEYRKESSSATYDALTKAGLNIGALAQDLSGSFDVKEVYGEVRMPLIRDSFVNYFGLTGAVRYSDYSTVGGVMSWNAGAEFEPFDGLRFRGVYAHANRAPNIAELYAPANETFARVGDPCDGVTATSNVGGFGAACRAIPAIAAAVANGGTFTYTPLQAMQINGFVGGNTKLSEEKAKTLTVGGVLTPRFLPGASLTVDYYDIRVDGAIGSITRQLTIQQCLQSSDPLLCSQVIRDPNTGRIQTVNGQQINLASTKTSGIDVGFQYNAMLDLVAGDRFGFRVNYTRVLSYDVQATPAVPVLDSVGLAGLSKSRATARVSYGVGPVSANWQMTYLGNAIATLNFVNANPAIVALNNIPEYIYHDVQLRWDLDGKQRFGFYVGVDNLFNKQPPYLPNLPFTNSPTGAETQADVYDPYGRRLYAGVRVNF